MKMKISCKAILEKMVLRILFKFIYYKVLIYLNIRLLNMFYEYIINATVIDVVTWYKIYFIT